MNQFDFFFQYKLFFQESLANVGCRAPYGYGSDMNNICYDPDQSQKAMDLYQKLLNKRNTIKECPYPCTFMQSSFRKSATINDGLQLKFNKFIKSTKARYAYQELEMLAEFGGYVGLFLGISVYNLNCLC